MVFDAATKANEKYLNDFLMKGPDLYKCEKDQYFQRFLWRGYSNIELSVFIIQVKIFGVVSSPFCAEYIKNRIPMETQHEYPEAVNGILYSHYMEDYFDSVKTVYVCEHKCNLCLNLKNHKLHFKYFYWQTNRTF